MEDYFENLTNMRKLCTKLRNTGIEFYNKRGDGKMVQEGHALFCFTPRYKRAFDPIAKTISISNLVNIKTLEQNHEKLTVLSHTLSSPDSMIYRSNFEERINMIVKIFDEAREELITIYNKLEEEEKMRLNEAIHCLHEGCHYASIALSVSATEFRLLKIMKSANPKTNLDKLTLGQLIDEYLKNKITYKNIIPKEHEPLLELSNTYRIFSVHPKRKKITKRVANSILNLAIEFLLSKENN